MAMAADRPMIAAPRYAGPSSSKRLRPILASMLFLGSLVPAVADEDPNWPAADRKMGLGPRLVESVCDNDSWLSQLRGGNYHRTMFVTIRGRITSVASYGELIFPSAKRYLYPSIIRLEGGRVRVLVEETNQPDKSKPGSEVDLAFLQELTLPDWEDLRKGKVYLINSMVGEQIFVRTTNDFDEYHKIYSAQSPRERPFATDAPFRTFSRCLLSIGPRALKHEIE